MAVRVPAFVIMECGDIETQKVLLYVYVPTTPVQTSEYLLLDPEEEVDNQTEVRSSLVSDHFGRPYGSSGDPILQEQGLYPNGIITKER
jgi:hypothetical protein